MMEARKKYLLFASLPYAYSILRPLQAEIRRRGEDVAWFIEQECPIALEADEVQLRSHEEVAQYNPIAVFTPGNHIPDFFPGVKVQLFHGYPINKRNDRIDDHFTLRGWFDIYCTQGPSSTPYFQELATKYRYFRVYETGWTKVDAYLAEAIGERTHNQRPVILYSSTFTRELTSTGLLVDEIEQLVSAHDWEWIFMFHPKLDNPQILSRYEQIAATHANATYLGNTSNTDAVQHADVMLCDSSSIILEFMLLDKPVVTFRNSNPGPHLIDVNHPEQVGPAIARALTRPEELMSEIQKYTMHHEPHRDCRCSARVLDAVDDFLKQGYTGLKPKPLNLVRKLKLRRKMHYKPLFAKLWNR